MTNFDASMHMRRDSPASASLDRAMLVHDIRCAVQGVTGAAALIEADESVTPHLRQQLGRIGEASRQLTELVTALVGQNFEDAASAAAGGTDLRLLMGRVETLWAAEAAARGMRFHIDLAPDLAATLSVEPWPLLRVIGNLICNALKHGGSDEVSLTAVRAAGGGVEIAIRDRGCGLSDARLAQMREPSGFAGPGPDGHGLGLKIARDLCAEIGGVLRLDNHPEGGLEAVISLPPGVCGQGTATEIRKSERPARAGLSGRRILLAEDNQTNQLVATQMLRALDAEVTLASDGVEALERFKEASFDLVIVDIEMPRLSGLDVIRAIRSRGDARAKVPIVALTAYAMREHRDRIAAAGADGLISKPLTSIEALGEALVAHLAPEAQPQPEAPAEAEEPVADQTVFDALCRAIGQDMMDELLEKVVADLRQARADLAAALSPLDRKPIRAASHILISVAGAIGATRLQHCARMLNTSAHEEKEATLPAEVRRCMDEIDAAVAFADGQRRAA